MLESLLVRQSSGLYISLQTRSNVAAIEGRERVSQPNTTQVYNLSSTFVSPDLDSFKASEYQIQQEQLEQLRRMNSRRQ